MGRLAQYVRDTRVLKLVRAFLNAGVLEEGLVSVTEEGTPQGGPLSPVLSNIVLHALDSELERRGHRFVRYADDCNVYVRSVGRVESEGSASNHPKAIVGPLDNPVGQAPLNVGEHAFLLGPDRP